MVKSLRASEVIARPCESTTPTFNCTSDTSVVTTTSGSCVWAESAGQQINTTGKRKLKKRERRGRDVLRKYDCFIWKMVCLLYKTPAGRAANIRDRVLTPGRHASGSDFTEYPGKQEFLQLSNIWPSRGCLQETGPGPYNLPVIFGRARCGLSCFRK